jgi:hypothetical protein
MAKPKRDDEPMRVTILLAQETLDKLDELRKAAWEAEGGKEPPARGRMIDRLVADAHAARHKTRRNVR